MCELRINENAWYWKEKKKLLSYSESPGLIDKLDENL